MSHPTKLTLRLDSGLIESAKSFAHGHQHSVSQLVANYFSQLVETSADADSNKVDGRRRAGVSSPKASSRVQQVELSPITLALIGALKTKSFPKSGATGRPIADPDKLSYRKHLEGKHL